MKNTLIILLLNSILLFFTNCRANDNSYPTIEYGIARFSGKIDCDSSNVVRDKLYKILVANPITLEVMRQYEFEIDNEGCFSIEIPVVAYTFATLSIPNIYEGAIPLSANQETVLNISCGVDGEKQIDLQNSLDYTADEMILFTEEYIMTVTNPNVPMPEGYLPPEEYGAERVKQMKMIANEIESKNNISDKVKSIIINEFNLSYMDYMLFQYSRVMNERIQYQQNDRKVDTVNKFPDKIEEPGRSYYAFLKEFNLNDLDYISTNWLSIVLTHIIRTEAIGIEPIGDKNPEVWIAETSANIKDLLGFDKGFFYDMLLSASYSEQLNDMIPLSEMQKRNIKKYFKGQSSFYEVLLAKNDKIINLLEQQGAQPFAINETSNISPDKIINQILSDHQNKVILIDFWATWCGPCLEAMEQIQAIKKEFIDKDVVFVYLADTSSPKALWESKIKTIGGEHYYLDEKQWRYLSDKLGITAVPYYMIYDKEGILKNKSSGYPGNEELKKIIVSLL